MSTRFDICTPRSGKDGKTYWTRIGTAWQNEKGTQLVFDALPIPDSEGRVVANLFDPKPKEQRQPAMSGGTTQPTYDPSDDVPF